MNQKSTTLNTNLNSEEQRILSEYDAGQYVQIENVDIEIKKMRAYAQASLAKTKNINIRITHGDLQRLKARAIEEGLPYQTLVASLIHKFTMGKL